MAKMKEDPLWMRITAGLVLRMIWAVAGFFLTLFGLGGDAARLMAADGKSLLAICLAAAALCAFFGPRRYKPDYEAGAGSLEKVKRMSGLGGSERDEE